MDELTGSVPTDDHAILYVTKIQVTSFIFRLFLNLPACLKASQFKHSRNSSLVIVYDNIIGKNLLIYEREFFLKG